MNLAERLNVESLSVEKQREEVAKEIVDYFKDAFESGEFESRLGERISKNGVGERKYPIELEFWLHHDGCSETHFRLGFVRWVSPEGSPYSYEQNFYKGVNLYDIQREVGEKLLNLAEYYLKDMGFRISVKNNESWLKYYKRLIIVEW